MNYKVISTKNGENYITYHETLAEAISEMEKDKTNGYSSMVYHTLNGNPVWWIEYNERRRNHAA